jgi:ankyrin repeat protein
MQNPATGPNLFHSALDTFGRDDAKYQKQKYKTKRRSKARVEAAMKAVITSGRKLGSFIAHGASPNDLNPNNKKHPLQRAVEIGNKKLFQDLISNPKTHPETHPDRRGNTALSSLLIHPKKRPDWDNPRSETSVFSSIAEFRAQKKPLSDEEFRNSSLWGSTPHVEKLIEEHKKAGNHLDDDLEKELIDTANEQSRRVEILKRQARGVHSKALLTRNLTQKEMIARIRAGANINIRKATSFFSPHVHRTPLTPLEYTLIKHQFSQVGTNPSPPVSPEFKEEMEKSFHSAIQAGAKVNLGFPLHWAVSHDKIPFIRRILENRPNLNARPTDSREPFLSTPLHLARSREAVNLLNRYGANLNFQLGFPHGRGNPNPNAQYGFRPGFQTGSTPAHTMIPHAPQALDALIDAGADLTKKAIGGTPFQRFEAMQRHDPSLNSVEWQVVGEKLRQKTEEQMQDRN